MAARTWKCRRCGHGNERRFPRCTGLDPDHPFNRCTGKRPAPRRPKHKAALDLPYEAWVERFGERCGICGAGPKTRRLHRDHDHATGAIRGILCFRCNTALPNRVDAQWLRKAADYLDRSIGT